MALLSTLNAVAEPKKPAATLPAPTSRAKLIRLSKPAGILTLRIKQDLVEIFPVFRDTDEPYGTARVEGVFPDPDSSLLINRNGARIPLEKSGKFLLSIPITGPTTAFTLTRVGPRGDTQEEKFQIEFQQWPAWITQTKKSHPNAGANTPRLVLTSGLGITDQTYQTTYRSGDPTGAVAPLKQLGLTVKIAADYAWVPGKWAIGGNAFITALPLTHTAPYQDVAFRVLGANFRVGYGPPGLLGIKPPWSLSLAAGGYFSTTLSTAGTVGYENIGGPQIYPVLKRDFANGAAATTYFKYSPILSGLQFLSLSSYELATGLGYWFPSRGKSRRLGLALDFAQLVLETSTALVQSQSVTLGVNVGL